MSPATAPDQNRAVSGMSQRTRNHTREDRLLSARQHPGAAGAAFGGQQPGQVGHRFPGPVEDGTIGNQAEPAGKKRSSARPLLLPRASPPAGPAVPRRAATAVT